MKIFEAENTAYVGFGARLLGYDRASFLHVSAQARVSAMIVTNLKMEIPLAPA